MSSQWYYSQHGRQVGPVASQELTRLACVAIAAVSFSFYLPTVSRAANARPEPPPVTAQDVNIGFYPNDVFDLDLRKCSYVVDGYVWLRWSGGNVRVLAHKREKRF